MIETDDSIQKTDEWPCSVSGEGQNMGGIWYDVLCY